ncbi:CG10254 [Drosophila busckii]|uniref:CG10254 n=1 Tax=Drosophila busckii TaxID=30019 RepID=A0A0M3QXG7_DROBS|nr:CG10254 [Drosophila busckii]
MWKLIQFGSHFSGAAPSNGGTQLEPGAVTTPLPIASEAGAAAQPTANSTTKAAEKKQEEGENTLRPTNSRKSGGGSVMSRNSAGNREFQFFFEDEVFRIDRKGRVRFGVITGTAETYSSDDEEEDANEALGKGDVRVAFYPDGKETVRAEKSIGLADRTLMPGDVVRRRLPGQKQMSGQAGYVRDVSVRADVKVLGTKYVIRNVPSERLRPISEWVRDIPVCLGNWIGYTVNVDETAVLRSNYGALVEISSVDFHKFKDAFGPSDREVFSPSVYYPNNVVIGRLPPLDRVTNLTPDLHLPTNRKRRSMYTVESVKTTSVTVAWTFKTTPQFDCGHETDPLKQPKSCIKGEELANVKRLNIYESYMLQIHDRFYLKYSKCDRLVKQTGWENEQAKLYQGIFLRQKSDGENIEQLVNSSALASSPAVPSSSRTSHLAKLRRMNVKSSLQRLNRSQSDNDSAKKQRTSYDDPVDSIDEDIEDDSTPEVHDVAESTESTTESIGTAPTNTEQPSSAVNSYASQAARIVFRNFKRRPNKKKSRPSKKSLFPKNDNDPKDGDEMVVETLVVYSTLTVVWQDGTVENSIPSTELYPIHHLDNHEFFPGDFVSKANNYSPSPMDYGVIQSVDHDERIAKVKWFNIYGNMSNPVPSCRETEELSVYDLRDHADYQYRPGTMVIRVSNFTGEDLNSTAGQVIDNYPDGRVRVWWAKGHITMCYPQDLFEIHQSDQEHDGYETEETDNSWETQSDNSRSLEVSASMGSLDVEEHIISGIDRANEAIHRLEKILMALPQERKAEVLHDLLAVYKNCRMLDRFLKTEFFHVDYFQGILCEKELDQANNSATAAQATPSDERLAQMDTAQTAIAAAAHQVAVSVSELVGPIDGRPLMSTGIKIELPTPGQTTSTPNKRKSSTHVDEVQCKKSSERINIDTTQQVELLSNIALSESETQLGYSELLNKFRKEYTDMIKNARASIAKAFEKRKVDKQNDSGVHSRTENSSSDFTMSNDAKDTGEEKEKFLENVQADVNIEFANTDSDICEVFCFLLQEQMAKCKEAILETFSKNKLREKDSDEQPASDAEECTEASEPAPGSNPERDEAMEEQPLNMNALSESLPALETPTACSSPSPTVELPAIPSKPCFTVLPNAPAAHSFIDNVIHPNSKSLYQRAVHREYAMLQASLPPGVSVRTYEDRMDLMSVMMVGPKRTPYENALFFFDFQMGADYPKSPPTCHYISYCTERLNPNLYEEGKVCVSLLGTWSGKDSEVWSPHSTMLQVLVSIQGLILVDEPYYNEAGYEKQRGTQLGNENSRVYNEMAIIKIAHSTVKQLQKPPLIFRKELIEHFTEFGNELHNRMLAWSEYSSEAQRLKITSIKDMPEHHLAPCEMPEFPLLPCSRGFCIAVKGVLETLKSELAALASKQSEPEAVATAPRAAPEEV